MKEELKKELAKFYVEYAFNGISLSDYADQNGLSDNECLTLISIGSEIYNKNVENVTEQETPKNVKVYFSRGISFIPAGQETSDGNCYDEEVCEIEYIEGILEFKDSKEAEYWSDELVNTMGAYVIPDVYPHKIIGLEKAIIKYNSKFNF